MAATSSILVRAIAGDHTSVRTQLRRRPTLYLRRPQDLAVAVLSGRTIRGLSVQALAVNVDLTPRRVRGIEQGNLDSIGSIRRVLRALDIEATALPTPTKLERNSSRLECIDS
jgi:ribosome-binding protein aMBF1 (putative translation factor)